MAPRPLIITGATGRIGRILQKIWRDAPPEGLQPIWVSRGQDLDLSWDILSAPAPLWPEGAVVLHLAGQIGCDAALLAQNPAMIAPVLEACVQNKASALLFASTAAVYPPGPLSLKETDALAPPNAYGASKCAAEALLKDAPLPVSILRIGNVAGAESLLAPSAKAEVVLDPVPGREGGPLRSWIGPVTLAKAFAALARQAPDLPDVVNLVQSPALPMADLLEASGRVWRYGQPNPAVVPAVILDDNRLRGLVDLPPATPEGLIEELQQVLS